MRRYIAVIQDARGYPPPGAGLEPAPPDGPEPPLLLQVVRADEHDTEVERLRNVIHWFESEHGIDDDRVQEFYALMGGRVA